MGDTVTRQLSAADLLLLNKIDLADDLPALRRWLSTQSPAPLLEGRHADVPVDLLFGLERLAAPAPGDAPDAFASWAYEWPDPVERGIVQGLLHTAGVLRAKGIVRFADTPTRRSVIHLVGSRLDIDDDEPWRDGETSRVVMLGLKPLLGALQRE